MLSPIALWRRRPHDNRHIVLAHGAVLMENQRREMVALVNAFYTACGLETRCQENSHIALDECLDDVWPRAEALWAGYRAMLDGLGERGV